MNKNIILLGALLASSMALSQVGIDTDTPKATLDVMAKPTDNTKTDGFIAPRLTGNQLKAKDSKYSSEQIGTIIFATTAASPTTAKTINVTAAGYYYFDGTLWVALKGSGSTYEEPWVVQGGTTPATTNSQAISQNASVAIGKSTAYNNTNQTMLDVAGAVRGGTGQSGVVGINSAAFGNGAKATGTEAFAIGNNTTASGAQSFAGGGNGATASGAYSYSFGNAATSLGNHAVAIGVGTIAPARSSVTLGRYNVNTFTSADITQNADGDPIFQLGAGSDATNRWNTITSFYVSNSPGWVAIGNPAANTMPERSTNNERLRVYGGVLSNSSFVSDINTVTGASTDKLVVADATTGQLKTIDASTISTAYQEPWVVQGGTTPATTNAQAISQNASVAIGKSSAYNSTNQAMLDVAGAIRAGSGQTGVVGTNSIAMGSGNTASGNQSVAFGQNTISSGSQSTAIGNGNNASGNGSFAGGYYVNSGSSASGQSAFAYGTNGTEANGASSFAFGNNAKTSSNAAYSLAFGNSANALFNHSIAIGLGTIAPLRSAVVLGRYNKYTDANYTTGSNANNIAGDPIFQVGQGSSDGSGRSNLITGYYGNNSDGSFSNGWVVIGANPTTVESIRLGSERLTVYGAIASTGAINAGGAVNGSVSTYPDYVFQNYYSGNSTLNPNYKFSNLYETEKFIKENHHLPGVTSVNELEKTENGYSINIGATATQALEKVEELYLHSIEQQKQIDELKNLVKTQQEQINKLLGK